MYRKLNNPLNRAIVLSVVSVLGLELRSIGAERPVSFITEVAPILKENCFACHNAQKKSGKFDMSTFEKLIKGGTNSESVVPEKPEESILYTLIVSTDKRRMPPRDKAEAVSKDQAIILQRWIKQGAKLDRELDPKADLMKELRKRWRPPVPPEQYPSPAVARALAFTPDNKFLIASGYHELLVYDVVTLKLTDRLRTRAERTHALAFLPDGTLAAAGGRPGQEGEVRLYDLRLGAGRRDGISKLDGVDDPKVLVKTLLETDDEVLALAISADGKRLAAGGTDRVVRVWDISGGPAAASLERTIENHADWVLAVAFGPDGQTLFSASRDKTAKVWNLSSNEPLVTFSEHRDTVSGVAARADGKAGFSAGADKLLRMWEPVGDGKQIKLLGDHDGDILRLTAHPSKELLATVSADKTVKVWDIKSGGILHTLTGLTDHVLSVAFSQDAKSIAAGSYAGELRIWVLSQPSESRSVLIVPSPH